MKEKRKYTMTEKALAQRRNAGRARPNVVRDWITVKIGKDNNRWIRSKFGTVNEALTTLREMHRGKI